MHLANKDNKSFEFYTHQLDAMFDYWTFQNWAQCHREKDKLEKGKKFIKRHGGYSQVKMQVHTLSQAAMLDIIIMATEQEADLW